MPSHYGGSNMYSAYTQSAFEILRKPQLTMQWYMVPLLLIVVYIVIKELKEKHYMVLLGGVALGAWMSLTNSGTPWCAR